MTAFNASHSTGSTTSVTSRTVDITAMADGAACYCLATLGANQSPAGTAITFTGWTRVSENNYGVSRHYGFFYRVKQAGDTTFAISWPTTTDCEVATAAWTGTDQTTPHEQATYAEHTLNNTSFVTASATPTAADRWAMTCVWSPVLGTSGAFTPDGALVERADLNNGGGSGSRQTVEYADSAGSVTQAAHSYTMTSSSAVQRGGTVILFIVPTATTPISSSDSGSGAEGTPTLAVSLTVSDTSSGADSGTQIALAQSDSGTGAESDGSVSVPVSSSDTGTGSDTGTSIALGAAETSTGTEGSPSVAATLSAAETGAGGDTGQIALSFTDTGAGTDASALNVTSSVTDTGAASDTASLAAAISGTDTAAGTDVLAQLAAALAAIDAATAVEGTAISALLAALDTAASSETETVNVGGIPTTLRERTSARRPDTTSEADRQLALTGARRPDTTTDAERQPAATAAARAQPGTTGRRRST